MLSIVVNTKGGVGKSAFSMQVVAPYLLSRLGSASLIEVDDQNHDASDYDNTEILCRQIKIGDNPHRAVERLNELTIDNNVVIDVGGNKTAEAFLQAAGNNGLSRYVDFIVIPVSQTGKDVENAKKTLDLIRKHFLGFEGKILLGATRLNDGSDRDALQYSMPDATELYAYEKLDGFLILPESDAIPMSRMMGMSAWEIAQGAEGIREMCFAQIDIARKAGQATHEMRGWTRKLRCTQSSVKLMPHLEDLFNTLDEVLTCPAARSIAPVAAEDE
ncbi:hypothetical protein VRRI112168_03435 [Vreelandella rituensis]|uniref:ParA family protein n=1 Tax=Vreelandella rituensis TaxID=2282306 RepID=A0A368UAQ0_9GAMM|nr:hypothetical protein [Halomonas rituensis]RCV93706.1 hypothetical protein DU506_00705 [Halomonas rituensis]